MIKLGTLSKLLTESTHQKSSSQTYICEASMGKISKATVDAIEKLIGSGKTDDALNMLRKVKFDKVSLLSKSWNTLTIPVRKLWTNTKKVAKVATGAAAVYGGYQIAKNIAGDDNKKDDKDTTSPDDKKKSDDRFNQPYDKIIATEPVYVMTRRHGQVFDDDDTKIKTMKEQEEELKQKEKEKKEQNQEIKIDLNNIYDEQGNQIQNPYSPSSPNFSFGKFIDKADNAFYDVGHTLGGALQGGINSIKDDSVDVYDTFKDTATGKYGSEEEK